MTQERCLGNPAFIKIFGERNCGTRAVAEMLRQLPNIRLRPPGALERCEVNPAVAAAICDRLNGRWAREYRNALRDDTDAKAPALLQWKHACPVFDQSFAQVGAHVIFMVRDPYSWAMALWRHPYHYKGPRLESLEQLLSSPWMTEQRDNSAKVFASPMQLWSTKLAAFETFAHLAQLADVPVRFLHFRDFLPDPVGSLAAVLRDFGIAAEGLRVLPRSTGDQVRSLEQVQANYHAECRAANMQDQVLATINHNVDWQLAGRFGYSRISERETGAAAAA